MITFNKIPQQLPYSILDHLSVGEAFVLVRHLIEHASKGMPVDRENVFIKTGETTCVYLGGMGTGLIDYSTFEGRELMGCEELDFDELQGCKAYLVDMNISSLTLSNC